MCVFFLFFSFKVTTRWIFKVSTHHSTKRDMACILLLLRFCKCFHNTLTRNSFIKFNGMRVSTHTHISHWMNFFPICDFMTHVTFVCVCVEKEWMWKLIISGSNFVARTQVNLHFFPPLQEEKKAHYSFGFSLSHSLTCSCYGWVSLRFFVSLCYFIFFFFSNQLDGFP